MSDSKFQAQIDAILARGHHAVLHYEGLSLVDVGEWCGPYSANHRARVIEHGGTPSTHAVVVSPAPKEQPAEYPVPKYRTPAIVYGPPGCGKTRNAEAIKELFGAARVIDSYDGRPLFAGEVALSNAQPYASRYLAYAFAEVKRDLSAERASFAEAHAAIREALNPTPAEDALRAEVRRLTEELETERIRLAACGVVALANTPESAAKAREMRPEYRSASCDDVARAVDREMDLRDELAELRAAVAAGTAPGCVRVSIQF